MSEPVRREAFPRAKRVTKRSEYLAIQNGGRRFGGAHFLLFARKCGGTATGLHACRLGITVSKKVGNAVVRNRVKRWVRESCRKMLSAWPAGFDLVVVAKPSAARAGLGPTAQDLASLARLLGRR